MDPALRIAASGMMAQQIRSDVIANNLANVNTTGFKGSRAHFQDLLYQTVQERAIVGSTDTVMTPAIQVGRGTRLASVQRLHTQGALEQTGRPLDLAIEGEGFLQVELPNGERAYTRDGTLSVSDQGVLVTANGYAVVPGIKVPQDATNVTVSKSGIVSARRGSASTDVELGRIELATFANATGLEAMGENMYAATPASGEPVCGFPGEDGIGNLLQGSLETSNVEIVQEMVDMIGAMRAYEINSKAIKNAEDMMETANAMIR